MHCKCLMYFFIIKKPQNTHTHIKLWKVIQRAQKVVNKWTKSFYILDIKEYSIHTSVSQLLYAFSSLLSLIHG